MSDENIVGGLFIEDGIRSTISWSITANELRGPPRLVAIRGFLSLFEADR